MVYYSKSNVSSYCTCRTCWMIFSRCRMGLYVFHQGCIARAHGRSTSPIFISERCYKWRGKVQMLQPFPCATWGSQVGTIHFSLSRGFTYSIFVLIYGPVYVWFRYLFLEPFRSIENACIYTLLFFPNVHKIAHTYTPMFMQIHSVCACGNTGTSSGSLHPGYVGLCDDATRWVVTSSAGSNDVTAIASPQLHRLVMAADFFADRGELRCKVHGLGNGVWMSMAHIMHISSYIYISSYISISFSWRHGKVGHFLELGI